MYLHLFNGIAAVVDLNLTYSANSGQAGPRFTTLILKYKPLTEEECMMKFNFDRNVTSFFPYLFNKLIDLE